MGGKHVLEGIEQSGAAAGRERRAPLGVAPPRTLGRTPARDGATLTHAGVADAYAAAGVDIEAGERAVELMKASVKRTRRPEVAGRSRRVRRAVPARPGRLPAAGAGQLHRRRRHQDRHRAGAGPARHHRHRPGGDGRRRPGRRAAPNRCSSPTTSPPARSCPSRSPRSSAASPRAACRPAARWSAARRPSTRASCGPTSTTSSGTGVGVVNADAVLGARAGAAPATS